MKKRLSKIIMMILLAAMTVVLILPCAFSISAAEAEYSGTYTDVGWELYSDGELVIYKNGTGYMNPFVKNSTGAWLAHRELIKKVTIEEGVIAVASCAFYNCYNLKSISIADTVTLIGSRAFGECSSLTQIILPSGVTKVGNNAFEYCTSLASVTFYEGLTDIGNYAFESCLNLTGVEFPASLTNIGSYAFNNCSGLSSVNIPENVTIGYNAFSTCSSLVSATLHSVSGANNLPEDTLKYVEIKGVSSIPDSCFYYFTALERVTLPDGVKSIGNNAFIGCTSLKSINIPMGVTSIGRWAFSGCKNISVISIPNSVESIDYSAFSHCDNLTSVKIPASVSALGDNAFWNCKNLTSVSFEEDGKLTEIGSSVFAGCSSLANVELPEGITSVGNTAFRNCCALTSVTIPSSLVNVDNGAFAECTSLENIWYLGDEEDKAKITISEKNEPLVAATWKYNSCIGSAEHIYDNACDTICNKCDFTREITHTYDNACDSQCNVCEYLREVPEHVYDNACDEECNICRFKRTITHAYEFTYDDDSHFEKCAVCEKIINKETHFYDDVCDSGCNSCDYTRTAPHSYVWVIDKENTCGANGVKHEECEVCFVKRNENTVINATGNHIYENICDSVCDVCDYARTAPHSYEWVIDKENNCGADGVKHEECSLCHVKRNVNTVISATGNHKYVWVIDKENTCGANGVKHEECSVCHVKRNVNTTIAATGEHIFDYPCDKECDVCGFIRSGLVHTYDDICDSVCNNCDFTREAPHSYEWVIDKENNCGADGIKHEECSVCHVKRNENTIICATGNHTFTDDSDLECNVCEQDFFLIEFDSNGGSVVSQVKVLPNQSAQLPSVIPSKSGYNFAGWATTKNGEVEYYPDDVFYAEKSIILYAQWNKLCSVCEGDGIEEYKKKCSYCNGDGYRLSNSKCTNCGGDGEITQTTSVKCTVCSGTGKVKEYDAACNFCAGYGGYFTYRCSNGHTTTSKYRQYSCSFCGNYSVTETIHKCGTCGGYGTVKSTKCRTCDGDGLTAGGQSSYSCYYCSGTGYSKNDCPDCIYGYVSKTRSCTSCNGSGIVIRTAVSAPDAPIVESISLNSVVLEAIPNGEYSIDGINWQDSPVFENLEAGKEYTFYQRFAKTDTTFTSDSSSPLTIIAHNHTYDNSCDSECNICKEIRAVTHTYSSDCDAICNICFDERTAVKNHTFADICDTNCDECDYVRILEGIEITSKPIKTEYLESMESLDISGGKLTLRYNDSTSGVIDIAYDMVSGFNNKIVGLQTLKVTYGEFEDTCDIEIVAKSLTSVSVTTKPNKTTYVESTVLDETGMVLTLYYNNNTCETVTEGWNSEYDFSNVGASTVKVTYGGKTCAYDVTVIAKTLTAIVVESKPYKQEYFEGDDAFDTSGLIIKACYNNNTSEVITDYTVSGYTSTPGIKTITVEYQGKTAVFDIDVLALGDCDGDGKVNTTDLAVMKLFLAGVGDLSDKGKSGADLNGDNEVNTTDLASLKLKLAGIDGPPNTETEMQSCDYTVERIDKSYKNKDGEVVLDHWYDLLQIKGSGEAVKNINAYLSAEKDEFIWPDEELNFWGEYAEQDSYSYINVASINVTHNADGYISFYMDRAWYMGGIDEDMIYAYTFSLSTGKAATLTEITGLDREFLEEKIRDIVSNEFRSIWEYDISFAGINIEDCELEDFGFYIENGEIVIAFTSGFAHHTDIIVNSGIYVK